MNKRPSRIRALTLATLAVVVTAAATAFVDAVKAARTAARAAQCLCGPGCFALLLSSDFDRTGKPRPTVTFDASGRPMHSWRSLVWASQFPIVDPPYDFDLAWDDPANRPAAEKAPNEFVCQNSQDFPGAFTNFAAIVDADDCSLDLIAAPGRAGPWPVVVEVPDSTIRWTEPRDVSPSQIANYPSPSDPGGFAVVMSDGRVRRLSREEILEKWAGAKAALRATKSPGR